jgi:biotin transport system substrate-specific component
MMVSLAGMLCGRKWGAVSALVYLGIGLAGAPVFTQGGGPQYIFQPSFGFLCAFAPSAYVTGFMTERIKTLAWKSLVAAQLPGVGVNYAIGLPYFYMISNLYLHNGLGAAALFLYCFAATIPGDIVKCLLAAWLGKRVLPALRYNNSMKLH